MWHDFLELNKIYLRLGWFNCQLSKMEKSANLKMTTWTTCFLYFQNHFLYLKNVDLWDFSHLPTALIHANLGVLEIALTIEKNILLNTFNQFELNNHSSVASSLWEWERKICYCTNLLAILSGSWVFCLLKLMRLFADGVPIKLYRD